jgi:hypothetical protein
MDGYADDDPIHAYLAFIHFKKADVSFFLERVGRHTGLVFFISFTNTLCIHFLINVQVDLQGHKHWYTAHTYLT